MGPAFPRGPAGSPTPPRTAPGWPRSAVPEGTSLCIWGCCVPRPPVPTHTALPSHAALTTAAPPSGTPCFSLPCLTPRTKRKHAHSESRHTHWPRAPRERFRLGKANPTPTGIPQSGPHEDLSEVWARIPAGSSARRQLTWSKGRPPSTLQTEETEKLCYRLHRLKGRRTRTPRAGLTSGPGGPANRR